MNPQDPWQTPSNPPQTPPSGGSLPRVDPSLYAQPPQPQAQQPAQYQPYAAPVPTPQQNTQPQPLPAYQNPQTSAEYSVDYLNSIAPNQTKQANKFAVFALIGGVLIAAIFAVLILSAPKGSNTNELIPPIAARIKTLQTVTAAQQKHLNENDVNQANATLNSALDTMSTDITAIIKERSLTKSQTKAQTTKETAYATDLTKTLDDAYQRGTLDRTYTSQITYEITILESQINSLEKSTANKTIDAFCADATKNLDLILTALSASETAASS